MGNLRDSVSHCQAGHDSGRNKADCAEVLAHFREINRTHPQHAPSTAELTRDGRFGLRPPNRINDLVRGKFDGHRYDFERISFGRGEYRWRLHEPNRPGYPKNKNQEVLQLEPKDSQPAYHRTMSAARRSPGAWKPQPVVPSKSWEQVCAERDRKMASPPDLVLTP